MKLYFLRHGEAEHKAASDFERELTEQGENDSTNVGRFCVRSNIYFTHVLTSTVVRAKQTTQRVMEHLPATAVEETEFLTPSSDPKNLLNLLRSFTNESRILCVTHEPFASTCISALISGTESTHIVMKPASFAFVETDGPPSRSNGKLLWLLSTDMIKSLL